MRRIPLFALPVMFTLSLLPGCGGPTLPPANIENIAVRLSFTNVDKPDERERVYKVAKSIAVGDTLEPKEVPTASNFDLLFVVKRLSLLDDANARILFVPKAGGAAGELTQQFNPQDPGFSIRYATIFIGGGIEVIVRFSVTPGAKLFYRPQGGALVEVTEKVDRDGHVAFTSRIEKGQEYFFAKAISGGVTKWLKINVFSQQVQEITEREFNEQRKAKERFNESSYDLPTSRYARDINRDIVGTFLLRIQQCRRTNLAANLAASD